MTKREVIFCIAFGLIVALCLQRIAENLIEYDIFVIPVTFLFNWPLLVLAAADCIWIMKGMCIKYHLTALIAELSLITTVLSFANIFLGRGMEYLPMNIVVMAVTFVAAIVTIVKMDKLDDEQSNFQRKEPGDTWFLFI